MGNGIDLRRFVPAMLLVCLGVFGAACGADSEPTSDATQPDPGQAEPAIEEDGTPSTKARTEEPPDQSRGTETQAEPASEGAPTPATPAMPLNEEESETADDSRDEEAAEGEGGYQITGEAGLATIPRMKTWEEEFGEFYPEFDLERRVEDIVSKFIDKEYNNLLLVLVGKAPDFPGYAKRDRNIVQCPDSDEKFLALLTKGGLIRRPSAAAVIREGQIVSLLIGDHRSDNLWIDKIEKTVSDDIKLDYWSLMRAFYNCKDKVLTDDDRFEIEKLFAQTGKEL